MRRWILLALACITVMSATAPRLPHTAKKPVEDKYYGETIKDDYRWLEDWKDPAVKAWSDSENAVARAYFDSLPTRKAVLQNIEALTKSPYPSWPQVRHAGHYWFALENRPPKQQPRLVRLTSLDALGSEKVLVDPNAIDPSGATTIDYFEPSLDGSMVAVSMSKGGTESGTAYVYETATGKKLSDEVPGVNGGTAGGSLSWNADCTGFWRTRYPVTGERPAADLDFYLQVYFHKLGTPASKDVLVAGRDFPKIAEVNLSSSDDGKWVLADVLNGDGGDHAMYLADASKAMGGYGAFQKISSFEDRIVDAKFGSGDLFLLSRKGAPKGKVIRLPLGMTDLSKASVVVPEGDGGIEWFTPAGDLLYVEEIAGGPSRVQIFDSHGADRGVMPIPPASTIGAIEKGGGGDVAVQIGTYTHPGRWSRFTPAKKTLTPTALVARSPPTTTTSKCARWRRSPRTAPRCRSRSSCRRVS